jgi:hypothetical protein
MRGLAMTVGAVFLLFVILQYNDPDSLLWIGLYGYAVLVSVFAASGKAGTMAVIGLCVYLPFSLWLSPVLVDDIHWLRSERALEALGLALAAIWMAVVLKRYRAPTPA